jgi:VIT1/CCC1 family predicted Fe2+/Mn2+ transporter
VTAKTTDKISRYRANLQDEIDSAAQYRAMAAAEGDARLGSIYARLADVEERHAAFWEKKLAEAGVAPGPRRASLRSRVLIALARRLGARAILGTVAASERADKNVYRDQPETAGTRMTAQEHGHARVLRALETAPRRQTDGSLLAKLEGRHRAVGGNALRAAVLGANDGLCSNLSLVMGVAGAVADRHALLVTGLAGLVAGACSMALGEWVSVTSARELAERELDVERGELEEDPASEGEELQLIYEAKGLSADEAKAVSEQMLRDPAQALDTLAREELGINPADLGGSAREAALSSFLLFAVGAAVPVLPFAAWSGGAAIAASAAFSAAVLFGIGAAIALLSGRPILRAGVRQLALGLAAAGVTFGLGKLLGVAIGA